MAIACLRRRILCAYIPWDREARGLRRGIRLGNEVVLPHVPDVSRKALGFHLLLHPQERLLLNLLHSASVVVATIVQLGLRQSSSLALSKIGELLRTPMQTPRTPLGFELGLEPQR